MSDTAVNLEDTRALLREVIRTIDKRTEFQVDIVPPGMWVALTKSGRKGKVHLMPAQVAAAKTGPVGRNELRQKIKREIDLLGFVETKITSTKMLRGQAMDSSYFRSNSGSRGRR